VSVHGVNGLIDLVLDRGISHLFVYKMLRSGLDPNRGVGGVDDSNWPLDFRQSSFTHLIQVLRPYSGTRFPRWPLFRQAMFPYQVSLFGWSDDLAGFFPSLRYVTYNPSCRHAAHDEGPQLTRSERALRQMQVAEEIIHTCTALRAAQCSIL
jgi:hypothetical protein